MKKFSHKTPKKFFGDVKKKISALIVGAMLAGLVSIPIPASANVSGVRGDLSGNGNVDSEDLSRLGMLLGGSWYPTYLNSADVNGDGAISIQDAYALQNIIASASPTIQTYSEIRTTTPSISNDIYEIYDFRGTTGSLNPDKKLDEYTLTTQGSSQHIPSIESTNWGTPTYYDDNRTQTQNQSIVQIWQGYAPFGTGTIVGPHTILTALHCVPDNEFDYDIEEGINVNKNLTVRINSWNSSGTMIVGDADYFYIDEVHVPQDALSNPTPYGKYIVDWELDYALLIVSEDLTEYGIVDLGIALNSLVGKSIYAAGYPALANLPVGGTSNHLYGSSGNVLSFGYASGTNYIQSPNTVPSNLRQIATSCYLNGGHSGGPFYIYASNNAKIQVGIFSCYFWEGLEHGALYSTLLPVYSYGPKVSTQMYNFVNNNEDLYLRGN
ncbi:MAG: trypsin-like peptidase domain-containing protein [Ruminococcus sp.]|jgi:hypothetical protein|nr:trypsin-like peptidase domain-containing protein [Ruminococcus sp.]